MGNTLQVVQKSSSLLWLHCIGNACTYRKMKITPKRTEKLLCYFNAVDKRSSKACHVCFAKKESILLKGGYLKTTFVCKFCPSEPGLYPGLCFEEYHIKIDFYDYIGIMFEIYCAIILRKLRLGKSGLFSKHEVSTSGNNQCSDHGDMLCSHPIGSSVELFFIMDGAVRFIIKDKKCHPKCCSFRAAVKK